MSADTLIVRDGPVTAPLDYEQPASTELVPICATASFDGTAATAAFLPTLEVIAPDGRVVARCPTAQQIAAGASADASWFPGVVPAPGECDCVTSGVLVETLFLNSTATTPVYSSTVLQAGVPYLITVQGTYTEWPDALNLGTPNPDAMFPGTPGPHHGPLTQVGIDPECTFARPSPDSTDFPLGQHYPWFQMDLGAGLAHIEPQGGPYSTPQPGYFYRYNVTGQGAPIGFLVNIFPSDDNYGQLKITIQTVTGSSSGGGAGSLLPDPSAQPNGAWLRTAAGAAVWTSTPPVTSFNGRTAAVAPASGDYAGVLPSFLTGATQATRYVGGTSSGAPASGTFQVGDFVVTQDGHIFVCTAAGSPGTWHDVGSISGVASLDSISGAITLVAGTGVTITDNSPSAGEITIAATAGGITLGHGEVLTGESTSSTSYTDLATVGPTATVTVGASGLILVGWNTQTASSASAIASVALSGANTVAANDNFSLFNANSLGSAIGRTYVFTGLAAGATTVTVKYRVGSGTQTFSRRSVWAIAP